MQQFLNLLFILKGSICQFFHSSSQLFGCSFLSCKELFHQFVLFHFFVASLSGAISFTFWKKPICGCTSVFVKIILLKL